MEAEEYVPLPKGDVHKKKEVIQDVTLHDLDVANARPQVLIHFLLTVKAATLIFITGHVSAISSAREGKSGFIYNLVKI